MKQVRQKETKEIARACSICGARIALTMDRRGRYRGDGYFFGKIQPPRGRSFEYWECRKCYQ